VFVLDFTCCFYSVILGFIPLLKLDLLSFFPVYFADFVLPFRHLLPFLVDSVQVLSSFSFIP